MASESNMNISVDDQDIDEQDLIPPTSPTTLTSDLSSPIQYPLSEDDGNNNNNNNPTDSTADRTRKKAFIWGTTINVQDVMNSFKEFISSFPDPNNNDNNNNNSDPQPLYPTLLRQLLSDTNNSYNNNSYSLNVNMEYLWAFNSSLYRQLILYPVEIIPLMEVVIQEYLQSIPDFASLLSEKKVLVRPFNLRHIKPMRDLDPTGNNQ